jgi:plastocyanin
MRCHVPLVVLLSLALLAEGATGQSSGGTIAGHVTLTKRVRGSPLPSTAYPTRAIGRRETISVPEIRNVVVYVKDVVYRGALPASRVALHQRNESFAPHVLAIAKGTTVDFPNDDGFFHNVFSLSGAARFNLGRYPSGQSRDVTFTRPGIVKVFCEIHSHMSATILVLDHPYFALPDTDGTFALPQLPAGDYTVVGWHERVGERTARVQVQAGQTTRVDLKLPVEDTR